MDEAARRVKKAASDARSADDMVTEGQGRFEIKWEDDIPYPIDEETLDEKASTQMGPAEMRRRDADDD